MLELLKSQMWTPARLFAQNFEDLYLYRFFSSIDSGFYIDAGAWHPHNDSVTNIFYAQGWRGINIDALSESIDLFNESRPDDINLNVAVRSCDDPDELCLNVVAGDPLASGQHSIIYSDNGDANSDDLRTRCIKALTLFEIIGEYAPSKSIDFLKLDVEGYELNALKGLNLPSLLPCQRPKVILLEATLPMSKSSSPCRQDCRELLEANSYSFLFFDGLNDYYCDQPYFDDFSKLTLPPNVFDIPQINPAELFWLRDQTHLISQQLDLTLLQLHQAQEELERYFHMSRTQSELLSQMQKLESRMLALLSKSSWK